MKISYQIIEKLEFNKPGKDLIENGVEVKELAKIKSLFEQVHIPENYNKLVERVSVIGVPDFHLWFEGGELALTTTENFPTPQRQRELLDRLIKVKSSCLAFHPGKGKRGEFKVFEETLSYAKSINFPILMLRSNTSYSEVIEMVFKLDFGKENVHSSILNRINSELFRYLSNSLTLEKTIQNIGLITETVYLLSDINYTSLLKSVHSNTTRLADIIKNSKFQEYMSREDVIKYLLNGNKLHLEICKDSDFFNIIAAPIIQGEQLKLILFVQGAPNYLINKTIDQIVNALSLGNDQKDQYNEEYLYRAGYELFERNNPEKAHELLAKSGFSLNDKKALMSLSIKLPTKHMNDKGYISYIKLRIQQYVENILNKNEFSIWYGNSLFIFTSSSDRSYHLYIVKKIKETKNRHYKEVDFSIGISSSNTVDFQKLYKEAQHASQVGFQQEKLFTFFIEIGFSQVFLGVKDNYYLKHFYLNTLSPLLAVEPDKREDLLDTLEVFLDYNLKYPAAAKHLFVHPNTVRYRIDQINECFGNVDILSDPYKKFDIYFALKLRRVLRL